MSLWYFITVLPFGLEVVPRALKLVTGTDFLTLQLFTALALKGFPLKKLFLLA
jgi:hypothetical protein